MRRSGGGADDQKHGHVLAVRTSRAQCGHIASDRDTSREQQKIWDVVALQKQRPRLTWGELSEPATDALAADGVYPHWMTASAASAGEMLKAQTQCDSTCHLSRQPEANGGSGPETACLRVGVQAIREREIPRWSGCARSMITAPPPPPPPPPPSSSQSRKPKTKIRNLLFFSDFLRICTEPLKLKLKLKF